MKIINQKGFTLLETLVAVVVLSISIVMIIQVFSSSLKSLPVSELHSKAVLHARAKMEEVLASGQIKPGEITGSFDDIFSWALIVTEEADDKKIDKKSDDKKEEKPPTLFNRYRLNLSVFWHIGDRQKSYQIATLVSVEK